MAVLVSKWFMETSLSFEFSRTVIADKPWCSIFLLVQLGDHFLIIANVVVHVTRNANINTSPIFENQSDIVITKPIWPGQTRCLHNVNQPLMISSLGGSGSLRSIARTMMPPYSEPMTATVAIAPKSSQSTDVIRHLLASLASDSPASSFSFSRRLVARNTS
jgi:hypothetical protein